MSRSHEIWLRYHMFMQTAKKKLKRRYIHRARTNPQLHGCKYYPTKAKHRGVCDHLDGAMPRVIDNLLLYHRVLCPRLQLSDLLRPKQRHNLTAGQKNALRLDLAAGQRVNPWKRTLMVPQYRQLSQVVISSTLMKAASFSLAAG